MRRELGMFVALLIMCAAIAISNPFFYGRSNIFDTTRQVALLGVFAVGLAFVIITGGIDLSVGSVIGLTGVIIAKVSAPDGGMLYPLWMGIAIALIAAMAIGLVQGLLITRLNLQPFIVTLGFMLLLRGVSHTLCDGGNITISDTAFHDGQKFIYPSLTPFLNFVDRGLFYVNGIPILSWPVIICLAVVAGGAFLLHFTVFGRYVFAIGGSRDAAEYSGIPVKRVETLTYVISAGLAGVAGILQASFVKQMSQDVGRSDELIAISAAVLGGCSLRGGEGTIIGVMIGAMIMRIIDNGINMFQVGGVKPKEWWKDIIIGTVILVAVILDQVVHVIQAKRRTRKAGAAANVPPPGGFPVEHPAAVTRPDA